MSVSGSPETATKRPHTSLGVFNDERADWVGLKDDGGRGLEVQREPYEGPDAADGLPELLAAQGSLLAEPRVAHHLGAGVGPAVPLCLAECAAPHARAAAEEAAHALARGGDGVFWNNQLTQAEAKTRLERNDLSAFARLGDIQDFHIA